MSVEQMNRATTSPTPARTSTRRLTVCLVSAQFPPESGAGGGIGTTFRVIAEGLVREGHTVHVISKSPGSRPECILKDGGLTIHRIQPVGATAKGWWQLEQVLGRWLPTYQWRYAKRVDQALRELVTLLDVDLVVSPEWNAETYFFARRPSRAPLVVVISGGTCLLRAHDGLRTLASRLLHRAEQQLIRRADRLTAMSASMATFASNLYGVPVDRITPIPNGVDLNQFSPNPRPSTNGHAAHTDDAPTVLFVGRLERLKGVEVLARAIPEVLAQLPQTRFQFVGNDMTWNGSGEMASVYLKRLIGERAMAQVTFSPGVPHEQLVERYRMSTVCVFPSYFESFGNVVAEAMACGKPVITTTSTGIAGLIEHGKDGWLVPAGNVEQLVQGIATLLQQPTLREELGCSARVKIETQCHPGGFLTQYEALFQEMADVKREIQV